MPFFVVGAVDGIGIIANTSLEVAAGAAGAVVSSLIFFILAVVEGTMGRRAGGRMITSIHSFERQNLDLAK
jgi:hypothetical protein